ncbi:hypothetical protein [Mucilaginibacter jinjuensis]|uniref:Cro/C1-type helix-turn-helix DNA-binding protein n=1 Tax=Mucilaginibacter jinjuensis TaxID=1176721 RepID=A0ABY7TE51_9SPHI|nr:hypothetical protein [Mucilaginibacter jinjuensis]WCT14424.1 hypothetical protein PQO05_10820 [Mucilaginibacter jinjuensis]
MSEWENNKEIDHTLFKHIKFLFENNAVKRMYEIREYNSGKISDALGINKSRYALKLSNPETFSLFEILRFSFIIDIDPNLVINVIQQEKEVLEKILKRVRKDKLKSAT